MLRTDLALEAKEMYHENAGNTDEIEGVEVTTYEEDGILVTSVRILNKKGSKAIGKPVGNYVTLEMAEFIKYGYAYHNVATELVKKELEKLLPGFKKKKILVAGLGNRQITSDALGPWTVDKLIITGHLAELAPQSLGDLGTIYGIIPGVMGITGVETADVIKGICEKVKPDAVIAVDALASRKTERVATTIQMSDTGITPGSGIGNHRKGITEKSLGVPVISIGVPMVVDALTLAYDAVDSLGVMNKNEILKKISEKKQGNNALFTVTPKETDKLTGQMANIISSAINITFHNISTEEIDSYIS